MSDSQDETRLRELLQAGLDEADRRAPPWSRDLPTVSPWSTRWLSVAASAAAVAAVAVAAFVIIGQQNSDRVPPTAGSQFNSSDSTDNQPTGTDSETSSPNTASAAPCSPLAPRVLPDGSDPGEAIPLNAQAATDAQVAWGTGDNQVAEANGVDALGLLKSSDAGRVTGTRVGVIRYIAVGGPGPMASAFQWNSCEYTVWLSASLRPEQAVAYLADAF